MSEKRQGLKDTQVAALAGGTAATLGGLLPEYMRLAPKVFGRPEPVTFTNVTAVRLLGALSATTALALTIGNQNEKSFYQQHGPQ